MQSRKRIVMRSARSTRPLLRHPIMPVYRRRLLGDLRKRNRIPTGPRMHLHRPIPAHKPISHPNVQLRTRSTTRPKRLPSKPLVVNERLPGLIRKRKVSRIQLVPTPPRITTPKLWIPRLQPNPKKRQLIPKPSPVLRPNVPGIIPPLRLITKMSRMIPRKRKVKRRRSRSKPRPHLTPSAYRFRRNRSDRSRVPNIVPSRRGRSSSCGGCKELRSQDGESNSARSDKAPMDGRAERPRRCSIVPCDTPQSSNQHNHYSARTASAVRIRAATPAG